MFPEAFYIVFTVLIIINILVVLCFMNTSLFLLSFFQTLMKSCSLSCAYFISSHYVSTKFCLSLEVRSNLNTKTHLLPFVIWADHFHNRLTDTRLMYHIFSRATTHIHIQNSLWWQGNNPSLTLGVPYFFFARKGLPASKPQWSLISGARYLHLINFSRKQSLSSRPELCLYNEPIC